MKHVRSRFFFLGLAQSIIKSVSRSQLSMVCSLQNLWEHNMSRSNTSMFLHCLPHEVILLAHLPFIREDGAGNDGRE
jgi:hypothetical protein